MIAPRYPSICTTRSNCKANVLQAKKAELLLHDSRSRSSRNGIASDASSATNVFLVSRADRQLNVIIPNGWSGSDLELSEESLLLAADAPILSYLVLDRRYIVYTSISGSLSIYDTLGRRLVSQRKDHAKYAIQVVHRPVPNPGDSKALFIATAGWDRKIHLYLLTIDSSGTSVYVTEPLASIELPTLPEGILFSADERDSSTPYLICSRRDSTFLYFYRIADGPTQSSDHATSDSIHRYQLLLTGKQNLAPYTNSWNAFSPSRLAAHPTDSSLIAVATSSLPHMKVLLVRLLFPNTLTDQQQHDEDRNPLNAAREQEQQQAREAAAVLFHANSLIAQTLYSMPLVAWRPDGSGVWVACDGGVVKGLDLSGKIVAELGGRGHDQGSKIRCLDVGYVPTDEADGGRKEYLISGGFDGKVVIWMS
jgi:hypothetical protein